MVIIVGLVIIFLLIICYDHVDKWKSDFRVTPKGYHKDWEKALKDISMYGKEYYYKNDAKGKYDIKDKK